MSEARLPGEDALIAELAAVLPPARHTRLAIGDDAAIVECAPGELQLITTDLLMEDVHFRLRWSPPDALGWKALAQNLSDIAAMGGTPTHAVIALALPPAYDPQLAIELYRGIAELAAHSGTDIIGGDTNRSTGPLTLTITVLGRVPADEVLLRSGAHPGDAIFVTGTLGRAAAGLQVLETGAEIPASLLPATEAQLRPQPRLAAGRALACSHRVTAMMDLSDGVATDLHRLCLASGIGAVLESAWLPVDPVVPAACEWLAARGTRLDPTQLSLTGGEDFELLLTAPADAEADLRAAVSPLPLTRIGVATAKDDILLHATHDTSPLPWGFTHFQ